MVYGSEAKQDVIGCFLGLEELLVEPHQRSAASDVALKDRARPVIQTIEKRVREVRAEDVHRRRADDLSKPGQLSLSAFGFQELVHATKVLRGMQQAGNICA